MARIEKVTMTNMCMVFDGNKVLVQDKTDDDYSGITFPGGHVEKGESFTDAVIREVFEETKSREYIPRSGREFLYLRMELPKGCTDTTSIG